MRNLAMYTFLWWCTWSDWFTWHLFQVDMDMEDDIGDALPAVQGREADKVVDPPVSDDASSVL